MLACFAAPVCGTASRARDRPLPGWQRQGFVVPIPLRCAMHPDGKPKLGSKDRVRVELANQLYEALTDIMEFAHSLGVLCILENPENSWCWQTSFFLKLIDTVGPGFNVDFHNCAHGGERPKLTRLWANQDALKALEATCDGLHPHKPWKPLLKNNKLHFATKDEAQYQPSFVPESLLS